MSFGKKHPCVKHLEDLRRVVFLLACSCLCGQAGGCSWERCSWPGAHLGFGAPQHRRAAPEGQTRGLLGMSLSTALCPWLGPAHTARRGPRSISLSLREFLCVQVHSPPSPPSSPQYTENFIRSLLFFLQYFAQVQVQKKSDISFPHMPC